MFSHFLFILFPLPPPPPFGDLLHSDCFTSHEFSFICDTWSWNDVGMWVYWVSGLRPDNVECPLSCEGRSVGIR